MDAHPYLGRHLQLMSLLQNELVEQELRDKNVFVDLRQGFMTDEE